MANKANYGPIVHSARTPNLGWNDGQFWRYDNIPALKLMKMQGAVELSGPGVAGLAGQIFPVKQDR